MTTHRLPQVIPTMLLLLLSASAFAPALARAQASPAKPAPSATKPATTADPKLIDLDGYKRIVSKYRGKPLLVAFWATWCEPCRDEFPMLVELSKQYAPQGLEIFGVSLDNDADMHLVRHFLTLHHPTFPNYRQKPGIDVDEFYADVNPAWTGTMPETIFYARDGSIAGHFIGQQPRASFEQAIQTILASPPATAGN
jgi:cytochrome c biogenesis protein CcmG/thiol:disulfide interchange protein DsbE